MRFAYNAMIGACDVGQSVTEFVLERTNQDAKSTSCSSSESISSAAVVGREYFRRDSIKHAVHDLRVSCHYARGREV